MAEHIAYVNPRVASFSQYLMSDDPPRSSGYRYAGFESGLRRADGRPKPAYEGFRLPLAVEVYGRNDVLWGLVRPLRGVTKVTIEHRAKGSRPGRCSRRWTRPRSASTRSRPRIARASATA